MTKTYTIHSDIIGAWDNFSHILIDNATKKAIVFDPGWDVNKIINNLKKNEATLVAIWLTHAHFDHVNALFELRAHFPVPVYLSEFEITLLRKTPDISPFGKIPDDVLPLTDNMALKIGETHSIFISTPGHSPGSGCFLLQDDLITGDTLFVDGCGRTDLFGSDPEAMFYSLNKLAQLPRHLEIHTGHAYGASHTDTLENQFKSNPYLTRLSDKQDFIDYRMKGSSVQYQEHLQSLLNKTK